MDRLGVRARSPRRLISSECKRDMGRIGEDTASSEGVVGNKDPPDASEVGEEESKPELETVDADVSVRARVKRSSPALAAIAISVSGSAPFSDLRPPAWLKSCRLTGG